MKVYLKPSNVDKILEVGKTYLLGYDDFNEGKFLYRHKKTAIGDNSIPIHDGNVLCYGDFRYKSDSDWWIGGDYHLMYEFQGHMCRGSGAERVYLIDNCLKKENVREGEQA